MDKRDEELLKDSKKGLCNFLIPEDWNEYEITERMYE